MFIRLLSFFLLVSACLCVNSTTQAQDFDPFAETFEEKAEEEKRFASIDQAQEYFDYCMGKRFNYLHGRDQDSYCACSAIHIRKYMDPSSMNSYDIELKRRSKSTLTFIERVAIPCAFDTTRTRIYKSCAKRKEVQNLTVKTMNEICTCNGAEMQDYFTLRVSKYVTTLMEIENDKYGAFDKMYASSRVRNKIDDQFRVCIKNQSDSKRQE